MDTDDDGLTDALELRGRGTDAAGNPARRFGAEAVMKPCWDAWVAWRAKPVAARPACREIDGAIPVREMRDRLNPTRRDAFLRLLWEPSSVLQAEGKEGFEAAAADPWINQAMATNFANRANHHAVPDSDVVAVSSREIALHLDAGAAGSVNMPPDVERFGGAHLVASGGANQGLGPWNYDLATGTGQKIAHSLDETEIKTLMKQFGETVPQSRSFWDLFTYGFLAAHSVLETMTPPADGSAFKIGNEYFTIRHTGSPGRVLAINLLHEYGHDLGLTHPSTEPRAWIWEGVMSYSIEYLLGCTLDKWNPTTLTGSKDDVRWCGDLPPASVVPAGFPNAGLDWYLACDASSRVFLRDADGTSAWTCQGLPTDYNNHAPLPTDLPVRMGRGPLDLATGYLKNYPLDQVEAADYTFSRGRLCSRKLSALDESKGLAICKERGEAIPEQSSGPIDFNANGVIDAQPVDLFSILSTRTEWFWDGIRVDQDDRDEWTLLRLHPLNNGAASSLIGVPCRTRSRRNSVTLTTCTD